MAIDKRINFRGGGMDMGNTKSRARSASMGNTTSRSTSPGTGGSSGNLGGGGGGQGSDYRQYSPPTRPTYDFTNIDQNLVLGRLWANFGSGNEFSMKSCTWGICLDQFSINFENSIFENSVIPYFTTFGWYFEAREHQNRTQLEKIPPGLILRFFGWLGGSNSPKQHLESYSTIISTLSPS